MAPSINIQWKGTSACLDVVCSNGHEYHVDTDCDLLVECPKCGDVIDLPNSLPVPA